MSRKSLESDLLGCKIESGLFHGEWECLALENEEIYLKILVDKGADVIELIYKPTATNLIWISERGIPEKKFIPSDYSNDFLFTDSYAGGWQTVFPNGGLPSDFNGVHFSQHDEVALKPWKFEVLEESAERVSVRFEIFSEKLPFRIKKTFSLEKGSPRILIEESIENLSNQELLTMWGSHITFGPPFLSEKSKVIFIGNPRVLPHPVEIDIGGRRVGATSEFRWPIGLDSKNLEIDFSHIPPIRLKMIARHAGMITAPKIAEMPEPKRIAILVAFVKTFEVVALDDALEVLDQLTSEIISTAKRRVQKNQIRTLKDLDKSALALAEVCALILNDETNNDALRDEIFAKISKEKLIESINTVNSLVFREGDFYKEMIDQYGRVQRFLQMLLKNITFKAAPAGESTLQALNYLKSIEGGRKKILKNPPVDFITAAWKKQIYDENNCITKQAYTLCILQQLQDSLRRRDIYVEHSERWSDTREKLLQGAAWQANRIQVSRSLGHSLVASEVIEKLTSKLDESYKQVAVNFSENTAITIDNSGKKTALTITHLDKLEESEALVAFKEQVSALLPKIDLTEVLLEIDTHTGFTSEFNHVSEANSRADDLNISICAVLIAEACNIGLEPLIKNHIPALTQMRLNWVKQNYLRAETLTNANAKLVNYHSTLSLPKKWGGGEVASADGMRLVVPIPTINARPNRKFFGLTKKGLTWYNFISNQYTGFHAIVVPGTLRDSIFVLEGILEQQTNLNPTEIMTDTAGASDMIFGLFWLLGYQFSPRLADAGESIFYRIDKSADYGVLNELAISTINMNRIEQHWDDMMRVAGSLKLGTVSASELIRSLLKSDKPSNLAKAIIDAGRINKTLYLLNYINDEDYRRRILTQLNRGEERHHVARAVFHGRRGEMRKPYREGQEDQLGALGLVLNAVVLWNTTYMESALNHLKNQSVTIDDDFEQRLSPLLYEHINVLGHYSFTLSEQIEKGKLRPLNLAEIP